METTANSVEEGNRLIAVWMNRQYKFQRIMLRTGQAVEKEILPHYNSDWNELMPVWYKFRDEAKVEYVLQGVLTNLIAQIAQRLAYGDIKQVWNKLTEAIQWYNTQNKQL